MTKLRPRASEFSDEPIILTPAITEYFKANDIKIVYYFTYLVACLNHLLTELSQRSLPSLNEIFQMRKDYMAFVRQWYSKLNI